MTREIFRIFPFPELFTKFPVFTGNRRDDPSQPLRNLTVRNPVLCPNPCLFLKHVPVPPIINIAITYCASPLRDIHFWKKPDFFRIVDFSGFFNLNLWNFLLNRKTKLYKILITIFRTNYSGFQFCSKLSSFPHFLWLFI